jgi:diaminopimelate decarboxylase
VRNYIKTKKPANSTIIYRLKNIQERVDLWKFVLPRVNIFYASKCLVDKEILKACLKSGTGFDVASA